MMVFSRCGAFLLFFSVLFAGPAPPAFRLGGTVKPIHYKLDLTILPDAGTFSGTIDIDVKIAEASSTIWLNASELKIGRSTLRTSAGARNARLVPGGDQFAGFAFDPPAGPGEGTLHIVFEGKLNDKASAGLFRMKQGGEWYAFTQFEEIDARRAFPCFDEPSFKTPWQLTLHVKRPLMAISNTPIVSETSAAGGMKTVTFAETRPLPSYLVALAVGPFEAVDAGTTAMQKKPIRIIVPRGRTAEAAWAAASTPQIVALLENYFGIPYPYEKLDQVAIPLFGGAMENAAMVTYGSTILLGKPGEDSISRQRLYAIIAAHELAHQWFGDLVTLAWWNDTWLNEAFATWMESKIVGEWKPAWHMDVDDVVSRSRVMGSDILVSARKIREPVNSNSDIANAFDGITYQKGAAVIHMFEQWIGAEKFQDGVRRYLKRHAWGNATADDFLASISEAAGRDVSGPFSTFLDQTGVPVVSMALECPSGEAPRLSLKQKRELPSASSAASSGQTWQIPFCARFDDGPTQKSQCSLLNQRASELKLETNSCPAWVLGNDGEAGYYRAAYGGDLLSRLLAGGAPELSLPERTGLIRDTFALARTGDVPFGDALRLVPAFHEDANRFILTSLVEIAEYIRNRTPEDLRSNYVRFVRAMFGAKARELGWEPKPGESEDAQLLRLDLVPFAADAGEDRELIEQAQKLANHWLADRRAIAPDMTRSVLRNAAQFGDASLFEKFYAEAKKTKDERERESLLRAMGSFHDPAIVKRALAVVLGSEFDNRETFRLLLAPLGYAGTRGLPFEFVKAHYDALIAANPPTPDEDIGAALPLVGREFCSEERYAEMESFFGPRAAKATGGPRALAQMLESIHLCAANAEIQKPAVAEFLRKY